MTTVVDDLNGALLKRVLQRLRRQALAVKPGDKGGRRVAVGGHAPSELDELSVGEDRVTAQFEAHARTVPTGA